MLFAVLELVQANMAMIPRPQYLGGPYILTFQLLSIVGGYDIYRKQQLLQQSQTPPPPSLSRYLRRACKCGIQLHYKAIPNAAAMSITQTVVLTL